MAHLWIADRDSGWCVLPLDETEYSLAQYPPRPIGTQHVIGERADDVLLLPSRDSVQTTWAVVVGSRRSVQVGGRPLALGLCVLSDRDEVRIEGVGTIFFSTETLAHIEPFPSADHECCCPRCTLEIKAETQAVRCPNCGVWHHQSGERDCWSYAPSCAMCTHGTALDAGFRWAPEES